ncbi:hypothetical protein F9C07_4235 [Aspergillus flavus]|uniref:Uncharacterized protein n=1 Tax=Aspergillus flavus (strain ATCC 200026 / FGSC A1120 / IAM 13836 / NRRL 3357 / JCM 12722 / SRRC 167) TaxID=332952 RepID=A0A7U2MK29_ASPFN|nr:hypothetical protein F9C07_4235 [Aspergillus flavus]
MPVSTTRQQPTSIKRGRHYGQSRALPGIPPSSPGGHLMSATDDRKCTKSTTVESSTNLRVNLRALQLVGHHSGGGQKAMLLAVNPKA